MVVSKIIKWTPEVLQCLAHQQKTIKHLDTSFMADQKNQGTVKEKLYCFAVEELIKMLQDSSFT